MGILNSLKYRIAMTIFLLEIVMLSVVLSETQTLSYELTKSEINSQDQVIIDVLAEASADALTLSNYTSLQPLFINVATTKHIKLVVLTDYRGRIVSSSSPLLFGQTFEFKGSENEYLKWAEIESLGELNIIFSSAELEQVNQQTISLGYKLGILGMILIAIVGVFMGYLLTYRLNQVIAQTKNIAQGEFDKKLKLSGNDEIASLASSLNNMVDRLKESFKEIRYLAYHDSLTKLVNRAEFVSRLKRILDHLNPEQDCHCVMFLDLDQFKIVNDTSGHEAGDELLIQLSDELSDVLRDRDTLARLGGDEFGVLLERCGLEKALVVAEKIRQKVDGFNFVWDQKIFRVGVSIGLVEITDNTQSIEKIMSLADMACYQAKDAGGNSIVTTSVKSNDELERGTDMRLVSQLNDAIEHDRWVLYFQRIHNLKSESDLFFGEFLLRLEIDDEIHAPGKYIEAAERYQLMSKIDCQTVEKIFQQLNSISEHQRPKISFINLSGQTIGNQFFLDKVIDLLKKYPVAPEQICFEITETSALINETVAIEFIQQLRSMGFKFALDDFGSGVTGFNYLKTMPVDILKIDGQFVVEMLNNKIDYQIVSSVNDTAHIAGFLTVAEFVENNETLDALKELGLDFAQGYALNKPEPLIDLLEKMNL